MKYCLSGRQHKSILKKCDEIRMKFQDIERIIDYIQEMPDKTYIIEVPKNVLPESINWKLIQAFQETSNIVLCIENLDLIETCIEHKVKFYWAIQVISYYELRSLLARGVAAINLGAPLSFDLNNVRKAVGPEVQLRMTVNVAKTDYLGKIAHQPICAQWVRPEDQAAYEQYIDVFEFEANGDLIKESTLYHIYAENKKWPGNLGMLILALGHSVDNNTIPKDFGQIRTTCKQKCMSSGTCHYCETAFLFASKLHNILIQSD